MEVRPGYKRTDVGVIPDAWEVRALMDLAHIQRGASPRPIASPVWYNRASEVGWIRISDVTDSDGKHLARTRDYLSDRGIAQSRYLPSGSLIMSICATVGMPVITRIGACIHDGFVGFTNLRGVDQEFLYYKLKELEPAFQTMAQTGSQKNLNSGLVQKRLVAVPPPTEQRAIAAVLSDVEALIMALDRLIAKKRAIRQGAMQELLTGKTRLPGFNGSWVNGSFGEIADIAKGQLITKKELVHGNIPVIAGGKQPPYYHDMPNRSGKTITISASGANAGYVSFHRTPIYASDCSTIDEGEDYNIEFIFYQLQLNQEAIYAMQTGGAQPHVHADDLSRLELRFADIEEQRAIAAVLSDIDAEIAALEARRDKTLALKKGMMQELLTGKTRLI